VDVFHRSDWVHPPTRRAAPVSTIHDLCPLIRPDWYAPEISEIHSRNAEAVAQDAAVVLTVSEFTRREFLKRFADVPEDRVRTVHSGLGEGFEPPDPQVARERVGALGLRSPYVLHVGTREKRKNLLGLVEIFAHLARKNGSVDLVLAGALPWDEAREVHGVEAWAGSEVEKSIQKHGLSGRTRVLGTVSSLDLVALYGGAAAFVFPSLCEGFGFPVLEAMACGTPVIASDRGAIPEIVAGAGILADPEGPAEFAEKVLQVLQDEELRRDLRGKGLDRAQVFTWSAAAVRTLDAYGLACEGSLAE